MKIKGVGLEKTFLLKGYSDQSNMRIFISEL